MEHYLPKEIKCPQCNSSDIIPISYGYPGFEMMEKSTKGKIVLGGCCITDNQPNKHCTECEFEWENK